MTRRCIVFKDTNGKFYSTPEFNGDKSEAKLFGSMDSYDKDWDEVIQEFKGITTLDTFKAASEKAQRYGRSCLGKTEILPVEEVDSFLNVRNDEVYLILNGDIWKVVGESAVVPLHELYQSKSLVYLTNCLGEETGHERLPDETYEWYESLGLYTDWLVYLVRIGDRFGMLAIQEVVNPDAENWDDEKGEHSAAWRASGPEAIFSHLRSVAASISKTLGRINRLDAAVLLGKNSGIYGVHEVAIFVPAGTSKEVVAELFREIDGKSLYF